MLNRAIDTGLMRMLVCLAQERSFSAAAEKLHVTQQAVSAQVKRLETIIGRPVVLRSTSDLRLTPDGEALLVYARQVVEITERVRLQFSQAPLEGSVRFGFTPGFGLSMLFPVLAEIRRLHPRLELFCETSRTPSLIAKLDAGSLDVVIGAQRDGERRGEMLLRDRLLWVGDRELIRPGEPVPLAVLPAPTFLREQMFELLDRAGLTWTVFFESGEANSLWAAILSGWGLSIFNEITVSDDPGLALPGWSTILPDPGHMEFFLRYDGRRGRAISFFADIIRTVAPDFAKQAVYRGAALRLDPAAADNHSSLKKEGKQ